MFRQLSHKKYYHQTTPQNSTHELEKEKSSTVVSIYDWAQSKWNTVGQASTNSKESSPQDARTEQKSVQKRGDWQKISNDQQSSYQMTDDSIYRSLRHYSLFSNPQTMPLMKQSQKTQSALSLRNYHTFN